MTMKTRSQMNGSQVVQFLTKREHFAAMAMQGLMSLPSKDDAATRLSPSEAASEAVLCADALLEELEKQQ